MSIVRKSNFAEKLNPEEHENLKDLTIVWFDRNVRESDDCIVFQSCIREVINDLNIFDDYTACANYLSSLEQKKFFNCIWNWWRIIEWSKKYSKIRGVYENKDELLKKLEEDANICLHEILPMHILGNKAIQKSFKELNEEGGYFIWFHCAIKILWSMKHDQNAKKELIDFSRQQYNDDKIELKKISDFEKSYTSDQASVWYTKDSFLYRLLNKALRTEDFDGIYKFRFFIADLHQQLKSMHSPYITKIFSSENQQIFTVYRGQLLSINEVEKIKENINGFISMNTFLSTTTDREVALVFSGYEQSEPSLKSVLFEINIEKSFSTEPFADISEVSLLENENEILFTIGAIFRINSVYDETSTLTIIELSLVKHDDENIERLTQYLNESIPSEPTLYNLNNIFLMIDDYRRIVQYSKILLKQSSITDIDRACIYLTLGNAHVKINGNYEEAQKLYLDAQQIALNASPCSYSLLASVYSSIGLLEIEKKNHSIGLQSLNNALQIALDQSFLSEEIIKLYSNLGLAYRNASKFDEACENYEKALNIIKQSNELPKLHPTHSVILNNLAYTKQLQYEYDQSLEYYNLAFEIQKKSLPQIHSLTATTLSNIALLHMMKDENEIAFEKYEKVVDMFTEIYGSNHPRLATVFNNIGDLLLKMKQYQQAKEYLNKALQIRLTNKDINDDDNLAAVYTSLAFLHCRLGSFDQSIDFSFKALDIRSKIPITKTNNIFITYMALAECYLTNFDYNQALHYYKLAQNQCTQKSLDLAIILERFADTHSKRREYDQAIPYLQESIDIQLQLPSKNNIRLAKLYEDIGVLYVKKGKFTEALPYFYQGLNLPFDNLFLTADLNLAIADTYRELKDLNQGLNYLEIAESIADTIVPVDHCLNAKIFFTTGSFYSALGILDRAVQNLQNAVTSFEKYSSQLSPFLCDTYQDLALSLLESNKIDEALPILGKIKEISLIIYPNDSSLLVSFYHRTSTILLYKNRLEESLTAAEHALAAANTAQPINYYALYNIYDRLSSIYGARKDFRRARIEVMNSFNICHKHCPDYFVLCQINLANIYIQENSIQEAIYLLNGISNDQLLSVHNYSPARLGKDMAVIYNNLHQYESSLRMICFVLNHIDNNQHNIAVEVANLTAQISCTLGQSSEALNHVNPVLADTYDSLAKYYLCNNNKSEAIKHFETSLEIRLRYVEADDPQLASLYNDIDQLYFKNNKYQELETTFGTLMKDLLEQANNGNAVKIRILLNLAHARQVKIDQSIHYYKLAIKLSLNMPTPSYKTAAFIYNHIGEVYLLDGDSWRFVEFHEKAIEMASKIEPDDNELITLLQQKFQMALENLIEVQGRVNELKKTTIH